MRYLSAFIVLSALLTASQSLAQQPASPRLAAADKSTTTGALHVISPGEVTATPEMWFYEQQLRRYDDPAIAFRSISAQKAAERRARLAAMKWYGLSNSRPQASIDIVHGPYSPRWVSGGYQPYQWSGPVGTSTVVVPIQR
ncbi:MAG: hypothetical protein IT427_08555 [Pirellulales bacterium]|nr:hypothetical protein [Pirellulales bacterium]